MHKSFGLKKTIEYEQRRHEASKAGKSVMFVMCWYRLSDKKKHNNDTNYAGSFGVSMQDWPEAKKKIGKCLIENREILDPNYAHYRKNE